MYIISIPKNIILGAWKFDTEWTKMSPSQNSTKNVGNVGQNPTQNGVGQKKIRAGVRSSAMRVTLYPNLLIKKHYKGIRETCKRATTGDSSEKKFNLSGINFALLHSIYTTLSVASFYAMLTM